LEQYLFYEVGPRFRVEGSLDAFDLFSIIIWKANRAKTKIAHGLLTYFPDLDSAARSLTGALHDAADHEERLLVLLGRQGFGLPMATAVLTVLYPDDFTVYDVRVCEQLGSFSTLGRQRASGIWPEYLKYRRAVLDANPMSLSLRDADRYLWARSAAAELEQRIRSGFAKER
jgi:hypothetical protein